MSPQPDESANAADRTGRTDGVRLRDLITRQQRRELIRSLTRAVLSAVLVLVAYYTLPLASSSTPEIVLRISLGAVGIAAVTLWQVRAIAASERPHLRSIEALALAVTLMVIAFATVYLSLSMRDPVGFSEPLDRTGALYFTVTTLATVGFGDITANSEAARVAVLIQVVFNFAVVGAAVRLILATARYRADGRRRNL